MLYDDMGKIQVWKPQKLKDKVSTDTLKATDSLLNGDNIFQEARR